MNPKIQSNLSVALTDEYVRRLMETANECVAEFNKTAQQSRHPRTFSFRFMEIVLESDEKNPETKCRIMWRVMWSLKAKDYSFRHRDTRDRYVVSSVHPAQEEWDVSALTFEDVLRDLGRCCNHTHKEALYIYAQLLGVPGTPLPGEI